MKKIEQNFILLLSDPSIKSKNINDFYKWLKNGGLDKCYNKASKIRKMLLESENIDEDWVDSSISKYQQKIINEIDCILRKESGMTAKSTISSLSKELKIQIPSSKRSFRDQILYLSENFDGSLIINTAYKIKNTELKNTQKEDWPLKEK